MTVPCSSLDEPHRAPHCPPHPGLLLILMSMVSGCYLGGSTGLSESETHGTETTSITGEEDEEPAESSGSGGIDSTGDSTGDDTGDDTGEPPPLEEPARYPGGQVHSPITPYVAQSMRQIALLGPNTADDVFMKTGASSTVSSNTLHCFIDDPVELGEHQSLQSTLDHFAGGDAAGSTPFDRDTEAAKVGHHAGWAISGDPSPIDIEVDLLSPSVALVHFGANDMGWGATYADALLNFHSNMTLMVDGFIDQGIVPIIFGITRRGDYASAQRWVGTWNATLRALAQSRQVPFVDLFEAIDPLPGHGLAGDGLHLEAYSGGACVLDDAGLQHGYNIRNLVALEVLERAEAVLIDEQPGLDPPHGPMQGEGTPTLPWVIEGLPFTDARNTDQQGAPFVDEYTGCNSSQDESGPELWYRLDLEQTTRIRAVVLDMEGVDIDLHLVDHSATGEGCLARGDHFVEATLEPGTHHFALDSWVSDGTPQAGEFIFVLVECDDTDSSCDP